MGRAHGLLVGFVMAASLAAGQGQNVRVVGQIGGACNAVYVEGNYAYIGEGPNLRILDVSITSSPVPLGRVLLPSIVEGVFVVGVLAYVADGASGLQIIDVTNPSSPTLRGIYNTPGSALAVFVSGTLAYVADDGSGLQIIDVSNPASPQLRGFYDTPGSAEAVYVSAPLAYVADHYSGLQIIDVTNPSSPTLRGSYDTPGAALGVHVSGGLAYVADWDYRLQIIDVTNPSSPTYRGWAITPGGAIDVHVSGSLAYVANYDGGLQIIDVTNPSTPTLRGSYDTPGWAGGVAVSGALAYVADGGSGLLIIDVSNPSAPTLRGSFDTPGYAQGISASGGMAYVADGLNGLRVIDVTNPSSPSLRGTYDTPGHALGVYVTGGLAYVADDWGLQIINVTNPSSPTLRGSYDTPDSAYGVYVTGGLAYVADWGSGLQIIDVSNPTTPTLRSSYDTPGYAHGVCVTGGLAYVADYYTGLQIIDISNPSSPQLRGSYDTPGYAWGVYVTGGLAYVADNWSNLQIIDVSNPSAPTLRAAYNTPRFAEGVYVTGGLAYVAGWDSGLQIVDVSNPSAPTLRGAYNTPGYAEGVHVAGGLAYVADGEGGLWILQYTGEAPRVEGATISDVNNNGTVEAGDQLVLTLDRSVVVTTTVLQASHFFLAVQGDSLGGAGFAVDVNAFSSRYIVLTLGAGVHLTAAGQFSTASLTVGAPSGIDFATSIPFRAIQSLDGISAIDGGVFGVDDSGIDVELSMVGASANVGTGGGSVAVVVSPDAAYTQHELSVPAGALAAATQFTLRPPAVNLGVINAIQIESSNPGVTFAVPARVHVEFLEGDVDWERGQLAAEMKVHQLVENPPGDFRYVRIPGIHTVESVPRPDLSPTPNSKPATRNSKLAITGGRVSVGLTTLNPLDSWGTIRVFAGLPIETVDERTINIRPGGAGGIVGGEQALCTLRPGTDGAYRLHEIEFPGYEVAPPSDPARVVVTMRTATLAEREALSGGQSFPAQSGAVFTVTTTNASSQPVAFTAPVHVTVQFKNRAVAAQSDVVDFASQPGRPLWMRFARDRFDGEAVDFQFAGSPQESLDTAAGTVTVRNWTALTGADGLAAYGAVSLSPSLRTARWALYR